MLWDERASVDAWTQSKGVRALTLDTSSLAEYTHQVQPKAMGWDAVISLWNRGVLAMYDHTPMHNHGDVPVAKPAWVEDVMGEGDARAKLPVDAYLVTCVFSVAPDEGHGTADLIHYGDVFEAMMSIKVLQNGCFEGVDGFKGFLMLKRSFGSKNDAFSEGTHMTMSVWRDEASYKAWQQSDSSANFRWSGFDNQVKLLRPPSAALYEGLLVLESYQGLAGTFVFPDGQVEAEKIQPKWSPFGGFSIPGAKCGNEPSEERGARKLALALSEEAWFSTWRRDFGCWWGALPGSTQRDIGHCFGALSLHLGAQLERILRRPLYPKGGMAMDAESGCEWIEDMSEELQLPNFPSLGGFEFTLPPIPRLLPLWEQLQIHSSNPMQRYDNSPAATRTFALGTGMGLALGTLLVLLVTCGRRRHQASSVFTGC